MATPLDLSEYDRRDARQQSAAFVGFTFLASWTVWSALWAPGVNRLPFVPWILVIVGWWAPAVVAALNRRLFRPRRGPDVEPPELEPAPLLDYLLAVALAILCCALAFGVAYVAGSIGWQWTWRLTGAPIDFTGPGARLPLEIYDLMNLIALCIQTAFVEVFYWFGLLIFISGAEIGWRGAFLPQVTGIGLSRWQASLVTGALYGVWLWPLVWRGNVTGFYPGEPLLGMLAAVAFGAGWGALLGWLYFRNLRLAPVVVAATTIAWVAMVLPLFATPFNALLFADPRSLTGSTLAGILAALLWRFAPPTPPTPIWVEVVETG